mgnify:CR=1 FL=1
MRHILTLCLICGYRYGHAERFSKRCLALLDTHTRALFPRWCCNELLFDRLEGCGVASMFTAAVVCTLAAYSGSLSPPMVALVLT